MFSVCSSVKFRMRRNALGRRYTQRTIATFDEYCASVQTRTGCSPRALAYALPAAVDLEDAMVPTVSGLWPYLMPVLLLIVSNVFMTVAWYGHLKYKSSPLYLAVLVSWGIAFFEYCLAVPANRFGNATFSAAQLKTMQEVITLVVFAGFSVVVLKEPLGWNHAVGFALIAAGAAFIFAGRA
jgi:uncharacterized protein